MLVREFQPSDLDALKRIHSAQTFPYAFPNLADPLFLTKLVVTPHPQNQNPGREVATNETSQFPIAAAMLRLTAEAYFLIDPQLTNPRDRYRALLALHEATRQDALSRGLQDVHAWLPPQIAPKFGKRLTKLGWSRDDEWTPYHRRLE
jgi:hypothetical protein